MKNNKHYIHQLSKYLSLLLLLFISVNSIYAQTEETKTNKKPLVIINDIKMGKGYDFTQIKPEEIESISVLKGEDATTLYGDEGKDHVIIVKTKKGLWNKKKIRRDSLRRDRSKNDIVPKVIKRKLGENAPLIIIDGVKMKKGFDIEDINQSDIESISFIKPQTAISTYAEEGKNGVYIIATKKGPIMYNVKKMNDLQEKGDKARKELKERSGITDNN